MSTREPRSPQEFIEHASHLAAAGKERELLAFADRFGDQFFGRFTPEERNRLEGIYETAQAIVDLEEWNGGHEKVTRAPAGASSEEGAVRTDLALPAKTGRS